MVEMKVDQTKILSRDEISAVLADLQRRARRSVNSRQNLILFRLATCCGLRVSELCGLRLGDVRVGVARPYIYVRKETAKRHKPRRVPLWWDGGTLSDLSNWKARAPATRCRCGRSVRMQSGPRLCRQTARRFNARSRFKAACRVLGPERVAELTIHHGRHSFVSHALRFRTLAEVRDAAGHANIATTSIYAHVVPDDDGQIGVMF